MSALASGSGSGSTSARDADDVAILLRILKVTGADCDHLSASQKDILARAHCIGTGGGVEEEEEEAEVISTPPLTLQHPLRQGQSQQGQAGEGEDGVAMCSMPFAQTHPSSPSSASSDSRQRKPRKPRKPTRKVRAGTKIWPPTPTATATPTLAPAATATATATPPATATASPSPELDPLVRMVLMVPTAPLPPTGYKNILELARSRGLFDPPPPLPTTGQDE